MKRLLLALTLSLPIALTSCGTPSAPSVPAPPRTSIQIVASALLTTAQSVGDLQTAVINMNAQKLLSDATTGKILQITTKLSLAGKQADAITASLSSLNTAQKNNLAAIFNPILQSINESLASGLIPASGNTDTIRLMLTTIQGALSGIEVALAGSN